MYEVLISRDLFPRLLVTYILMLIDYVSKWIKVVVTRADDAKTMVKHVKSLILQRHGCLK